MTFMAFTRCIAGYCIENLLSKIDYFPNRRNHTTYSIFFRNAPAMVEAMRVVLLATEVELERAQVVLVYACSVQLVQLQKIFVRLPF